MSAGSRRVVVTGIGLITPLGLDPESLWEGLVSGTSGVGPITQFPTDGLPITHAAEASGFTGDIADFGPLTPPVKKAIRKGQKVMCRESQMAVAAAQRAISDAGLVEAGVDPRRIGCVFGSDYMLTLPDDFTASVAACRGDDGAFDYDRWASDGMPLLAPLWLLKYLPNMPASHIAIYNDLQGPSNSLTLREASGHVAVGEAAVTIQRGSADVMLAGSTGTRIHPMKTVHALLCEEVATGEGDPTGFSRPFDRDRHGMVLGEGAAVFVLEELEHARKRSATIHAEVIGHASRTAADRRGGDPARAMGLAMRAALAMASLEAADLGHLHARGLGTTVGDREDAAAASAALGDRAGKVPAVAAKGHFDNLGGASGLVELAASVLAMRHGELFAVRNFETPDPDCPLAVARGGEPAGTSCLSVATTPQGQAAAVALRAVDG